MVWESKQRNKVKIVSFNIFDDVQEEIKTRNQVKKRVENEQVN